MQLWYSVSRSSSHCTVTFSWKLTRTQPRIVAQMKGETVVFSTGTDEHGLKVLTAAEKAGLAPQEYCDGVSSSFRNLFDRVGVECDDFVRTTDARHAAVVRDVWRRLDERGFIYKGEYVDCAFLPPDMPASAAVAMACGCLALAVTWRARLTLLSLDVSVQPWPRSGP
jgi:hypothetical protein